MALPEISEAPEYYQVCQGDYELQKLIWLIRNLLCRLQVGSLFPEEKAEHKAKVIFRILRGLAIATQPMVKLQSQEYSEKGCPSSTQKSFKRRRKKKNNNNSPSYSGTNILNDLTGEIPSCDNENLASFKTEIKSHNRS